MYKLFRLTIDYLRI